MGQLNQRRLQFKVQSASLFLVEVRNLCQTIYVFGNVRICIYPQYVVIVDDNNVAEAFRANVFLLGDRVLGGTKLLLEGAFLLAMLFSIVTLGHHLV
jgi:hypothetical protein